MNTGSNILPVWSFAFVIILLQVSCTNKETVVSPYKSNNGSISGNVERSCKIPNTKTQGLFMFESNVVNNDPKLTNGVIKGGFFTDASGTFETDGGDVYIGPGGPVTNKNGWYGFNKVAVQPAMYGANVTFTLTPPKSHIRSSAGANQGNNLNGATNVSVTLYSPKAIIITNVAPLASIHLVPNTSTTITWNADPLNTNGVVIMANYAPTRIVNYHSNKAGYTQAHNSSVLVTDNGSTSIPWSFFSQIPQGSHFTLWAARGNYTILKNGDYSYKVGGYSATAVWDVVAPCQTH